ncbi:MAG TPA: TraR/DksA C4-type zinc finger protein [Gemmatimonadota bacterium]|nr:TraR/DksA C4-type zinc finger protein [Gemmatimonadota bacterium]
MAQKKKGSGASRKSKKSAKKGSRKTTASKSAKKSVKKTARKKATARKAARRNAPKKAARKSASRKKATAKRTPSRTVGAAKAPARRTSAPSRPARPKGPPKRAPGRDAAFFDHFRQKLLDQRQQITRRLDELRDELRGLEETPRELEEWAQEEKDRDILIRLEDRETEELRKIQAALGLIDRKEYGYCQNCGKPIPRARLEELPTAFRCVDCTA